MSLSSPLSRARSPDRHTLIDTLLQLLSLRIVAFTTFFNTHTLVTFFARFLAHSSKRAHSTYTAPLQ
jgi:hypothetical protein